MGFHTIAPDVVCIALANMPEPDFISIRSNAELAFTRHWLMQTHQR